MAQRYLKDSDTDANFKYNTTFFFQIELTGIRGYQSESPLPSAYGTYDYYQ